jgi:NADH-quinone oxidoreductase subunit D
VSWLGSGSGRSARRRADFATQEERDLPIAPLHLFMDPSHPATRGAFGLQLDLDGEQIVGLEVEIGHLHRGFEKECESRSWYQAIPYVERLNADAATLYGVGFCLAVEKLLEVETPVRCCWLRMLASELSRAGDHLARIGNTALGLQATALFACCNAAREIAWGLQEALSGARVTSHYLRIGGLAHGLPPGFLLRCRDGLVRLREALREIDTLSTHSPGFVMRLRDTGMLSREDCQRYGVTGPLLRAAGVGMDLRKDEPYLCYEELDFDVPVGEVGDNYDRHLVCLEETRQSVRIVEQCLARLEALGPGPLDVADGHIRWPEKARVSARLLEMIQHFKGVSEGPLVPAGETYVAIESAGGELGFYLVSDGSCRPVKLRCRAPSFFHLQALPQMLRGGLLSDLPPTIDLVRPVAGECDR